MAPGPALDAYLHRLGRSDAGEAVAGPSDSAAHEPLPAPARVRAGDAAADLPANMDLQLGPGERALVPTGFAIALPAGHCGLILSRSGLVLHHGIIVLNAPGLVDSGYRGELKVILLNTSADPYVIKRGERIAQLLIVAVAEVGLRLLAAGEALPAAPDDRGEHGFGSSGYVDVTKPSPKAP